jgi:hypothetical protein
MTRQGSAVLAGDVTDQDILDLFAQDARRRFKEGLSQDHKVRTIGE